MQESYEVTWVTYIHRIAYSLPRRLRSKYFARQICRYHIIDIGRRYELANRQTQTMRQHTRCQVAKVSAGYRDHNGFTKLTQLRPAIEVIERLWYQPTQVDRVC